MNACVDKNRLTHTIHALAALPELKRCYSHEYTHLHVPTLHIIAGLKSNIITHDRQKKKNPWYTNYNMDIKIIHCRRLDFHFYTKADQMVSPCIRST